MKKILFYSSAVLLLACSGNKQKQLLGTWKMTSYTPNIETLDSGSLQRAVEEGLSVTYEFREDSVMLVKSKSGPDEGQEIKWYLDSNDQRMTFKFEFNGEEFLEQFNVVEQNDKTLKLYQKLPQLNGELTMELEKVEAEAK